MDQLIKVDVKNNQQVLSARDLYNGLEIAQRFSRWVLNNFEMFEEGIDYVPCTSSTQLNQYGGTKEIDDYTITIDMAKQLAMMVRNDNGKRYRKYFLKLEEKWNDPQEVVKRGYEILQSENTQLKLENNQLKPKAQFAEQIAKSNDTILVRDLAKLLYKNGIAIGQKELFRWLLEKGYLIKQHNGYVPTQKAVNLKVFEVRETPITHQYTQPTIKFTTLVTTKGQQYFIKKFLEVNSAMEA